MRFAAFCLAPLVLATLSACAPHPRAADVRLPAAHAAPASATFDVSWEVDPWGRGFIAYDAATAEVDRVRFGYEAARALVASNVADAWFLARGLAIQLADAQQTARIQQELYDAATKRAQVGISPTSEADRIAGELSQAKAN